MPFINGRYRNLPTETIDEFETMKETRAMLAEYRLAFGPDFRLWISQRPTNDWKER
jgi:hypothetical protein